MKAIKNTARAWLIENGHAKIARMIEEVMEDWKSAGKKTRRDWWEVLAGNLDGSPKIIEGRKFPVLAAARKRMGLLATRNSVRRKHEKETLPITPQQRWEKLKSQEMRHAS